MLRKHLLIVECFCNEIQPASTFSKVCPTAGLSLKAWP